MTLSIVVPAYNEQECIRPLFDEVHRILSVMPEINFSVLYVDDGSTDDTAATIRALAAEKGDAKVRYVSFSRNFGKESAIFAGLSKADGECIVLMDADLQHPPSLLPKMLDKINEGYDCCGARRVSRNGEPPIRSVFSKMFYSLMKKTTGLELVQGGSDFRVMTRQMVDAVVSMPERDRFTKGILSWVGFKTCFIPYKNVDRLAGNTKWSFWGLFRYAINGLFSFATTPLRVAVYLGFLIDIATVVYAIHLFVQSILHGTDGSGFMTLQLLILFFGGTLILLLGVVGEYLARIYNEIKQRPIFIVKDSNIDN